MGQLKCVSLKAQHLPFKLEGKTTFNLPMMKDPRQQFGEDMRKLVGGGNMGQPEELLSLLVSDEVTIHFDMLCTHMEHWVLRNMKSCHVITEDKNRKKDMDC